MARDYDPYFLKQCGWLLKELEMRLKRSAMEDSWRESRNQWIKDVDAAVSKKELWELYKLTDTMEKDIKYDKQNEWKRWKRHYWRGAYLGKLDKGIDTTVTVTHFTRCLAVLEASLSDEAFESSWEGRYRSMWLKKLENLHAPVENVLFAMDVLDQIEKFISNDRTVDEWGRYIDEVCSKLHEGANSVQKAAKDAGIAKATGGGVSIGGGVLTALGLILAPFTAGTSLIATGAGAVMAIGGGATSFGASMGKHGADKKAAKEGEKLTKTACKEAAILSLCLRVYVQVMQEFNKYLDTQEGQEVIHQLRSIDRVHSSATKITIQSGSKAVSFGLAGMKFAEAVKIIKAISALRPSLAGPFASKLATSVAAGGLPSISVKGVVLFAGVGAGTLAAKLLTGVGAVSGIGFGIWEVVSASQDLQNGSAIARDFRKLAENLKTAKNNICEQYEAFVDDDEDTN